MRAAPRSHHPSFLHRVGMSSRIWLPALLATAVLGVGLGWVVPKLYNKESCALSTGKTAQTRVEALRQEWNQLRSWVGGAVFQLQDETLDTAPSSGASPKVLTLFGADRQCFVTPTYRQSWIDATDRLEGRIHPRVRELSVTLYANGWTMHRVWGQTPAPGFLASSTNWFRQATSEVDMSYESGQYRLSVRTDEHPQYSAVISAVLHDDWLPADLNVADLRQQTHVRLNITKYHYMEVELVPNSTRHCNSWIHQQTLDANWIVITALECHEGRGLAGLVILAAVYLGIYIFFLINEQTDARVSQVYGLLLMVAAIVLGVASDQLEGSTFGSVRTQ